MNDFKTDIRVVMGVLVSILTLISLIFISVSFVSWLDKHDTYRKVEKIYFETVVNSQDEELINNTKDQIQYIKGAATRQKNQLIDDIKTVSFFFLTMVIVYLFLIVSFTFVRQNDVIKVEKFDDNP